VRFGKLCVSEGESLKFGGVNRTLPAPETETPGTGEGVEGLQGSQSVARAEGNTRNEEARRVPAALIARAKQEGRRNDKK